MPSKNRTNLLGRDDSLPFKHAIKLIHRQILQRIHGSRRPANLNRIDFRRGIQTKMDSQIILGKIAAAAMNLVDLRHTTGDNLDSGANSGPVALASSKLKRDPMIGIVAFVMQNELPPIDVLNDNVDPSIIIEVPKCCSAAWF